MLFLYRRKLEGTEEGSVAKGWKEDLAVRQMMER